MDLLHQLIYLLTHTKDFLESFLNEHGNWFYFLLFLIIFVETGIVIMPFLPGDSLLFTAGMLAAFNPGSLNVVYIILLLLLAAFLGDNCNYFIGKFIGEKALGIKIFGKRLVKQEYLAKTHSFYEKYGAATVIVARFVPIVRTIAPFVAGVGKMKYIKYLFFSVIGALLWVSSITLAGYFLGKTFPAIGGYIDKVIILIVLISVVPIFVSLIKSRIAKKKAKKENVLN